MERKLASVQVVKEVLPVVGISPEGKEFAADSIELVRFRDIAWQCVVRKDDGIKVGDNAVYIEISVVLPEHSSFEFMRSRKFRVSTAKFLKTTLSQGLCFPLTLLWKFDDKLILGAFNPGDDVSEIVGVTRYEPPVPANIGGDILGAFPAYIPKSDEIRIQSAPGAVDELRGHSAVATVKVDGSSGTFYLHDGHFGVCSRNVELADGERNVFWQMARKFKVEEALRAEFAATGREFALQGEVCGPGIQKNRLGLREHSIFFYNLYEIGRWEYLDWFALWDFCDRNGLNTVPLEWQTDNFQLRLEELLLMADGYYWGTDNRREGIVVRPLHEMKSFALGGRLSFKVVSNEFLLSGGE